jgi:hypothetical protein
MNVSLLQTALRVLECYADARNPDADDVKTLQAAVNPADRDCEPDLLAVQVIEREIRKVRAQSSAQAGIGRHRSQQCSREQYL